MEEQEKYQESTQQSKFNYAAAILERIDFLQYKANEHYLKGDLENWFFTLKCIKQNLDGRFTEDELKELRNIDVKTCFMIPKMGKSDKHKNITGTLIQNYNRCIQKKIELWGMGLVDKKDTIHFA